MKFRDRYDFLSNFYSAPINVNGQLWPTVEHAFQGFKTTNLETRECIRKPRHALDRPSAQDENFSCAKIGARSSCKL